MASVVCRDGLCWGGAGLTVSWAVKAVMKGALKCKLQKQALSQVNRFYFAHETRAKKQWNRGGLGDRFGLWEPDLLGERKAWLLQVLEPVFKSRLLMRLLRGKKSGRRIGAQDSIQRWDHTCATQTGLKGCSEQWNKRQTSAGLWTVISTLWFLNSKLKFMIERWWKRYNLLWERLYVFCLFYFLCLTHH